MVNPERTAFNSIIGSSFLLSIGLLSLFLIALEYLAGAVWSVVFRRITEFLSTVIFVVPILAIPFLLNINSVFHWTHTDTVAKDAILSHKSPYLNTTFFFARLTFMFLIWWLFYFIFTRNSKKQDSTFDQALTKRNARFGAVFMPLFAVTITIAAIDWLMSLEPHWFSTIFGVYYFSGSLLAALAATTFAAVRMADLDLFGIKIKSDHYYSLGALMFAFTNFWAYIAFSQFMLIWYANLPEETFWFMNRWEGSWKYITLGLIVFRFIVPYILILSQPSKKDPKRLKLAAIWILFTHYYDLYWLVMPNYSKSGIAFSWYELGYPLLCIGILLLVFTMRAKGNNLLPVGDPKLKRSIDFHL
ncbi:MAG: quinol:cytochrome C oxidoreductase [Ignavibacteriae bacterium]|nr:quinol:cytochrome C oxidoreductase [Ignavibacteriota bacterium]